MTAFWSLNEIDALARKAARGAGYDWGMAEETGQAVRWLLARDLPGADVLLVACQAGAARSSQTCPITYGCALSDGLVSELGVRDVVAPLLVLPFVAWTAEREKKALCLKWRGAEFLVTPKGDLRFQAETLLAEHAQISVGNEAAKTLAAARVGHRAKVGCETFIALSGFASRTYAPSTEASRESGAGAGLTDND